jgi:hypothetical protein
VLADSLRTNQYCFHAVRLDNPAVIRLRELSRLEHAWTVWRHYLNEFAPLLFKGGAVTVASR